jgi:hypothetical protein
MKISNSQAVYCKNLSVTTKNLLLSSGSLLYDMFQPTWPLTGSTRYVGSTWEEIINIRYYKGNEISFLHKIVVTYKVMLYVIQKNLQLHNTTNDLVIYVCFCGVMLSLIVHIQFLLSPSIQQTFLF